jgi:hypothetical protein
MLVYLLTIIVLPIILYLSYVTLTTFDNKYICIRNTYIVTNNKNYTMILYDYDGIRYVMSCPIGNTMDYKLMHSIKTDDHIVVAGYGYNFKVLNINKRVTEIKFV